MQCLASPFRQFFWITYSFSALASKLLSNCVLLVDSVFIFNFFASIALLRSEHAKGPLWGFSFFQEPRARHRRGGVGLFMSSANVPKYVLRLYLVNLNVVSHYTQQLSLTWSCYYFLQELQDILSDTPTLPRDLALIGDFNLRIYSSSPNAGQLSGILASFDLHPYVDFPANIHD